MQVNALLIEEAGPTFISDTLDVRNGTLRLRRDVELQLKWGMVRVRMNVS